jgi:hypothetical protein
VTPQRLLPEGSVICLPWTENLWPRRANLIIHSFTYSKPWFHLWGPLSSTHSWPALVYGLGRPDSSSSEILTIVLSMMGGPNLPSKILVTSLHEVSSPGSQVYSQMSLQSLSIGTACDVWLPELGTVEDSHQGHAPRRTSSGVFYRSSSYCLVASLMSWAKLIKTSKGFSWKYLESIWSSMQWIGFYLIKENQAIGEKGRCLGSPCPSNGYSINQPQAPLLLPGTPCYNKSNTDNV